jgi:tetratricopeptide (TPR) repeat protein
MSTSRRAILIAVALLGVAGSVAGCGGADARRATHIARGQHYMAEGRFEKARVEFANALQIAPNNAEARYLSGRAAERLGDLRGAAAMYRGAVEVDPAYTEAQASLARLYALSTTPEKALELIDPALVRHPDDAEFLIVRAMARQRLKDAAGALADAERAVVLAPSNEDAVSVLATLRAVGGQPQRAVELLLATIARTPDSIALRQRLAEMYLAAGDDKLAEEQLLQIVRTRPDELGRRLELAAFYVRAKRPNDADSTLKGAVAALPGSGEAKLAYAEFLAANGSSGRSEAMLRGLIAQDPHNYDLQFNLAALQQRAGRSRDAVATYRAVIAADPNGAKAVAARDRIATISAVAGNYAEALRQLNETLSINPRDGDALTLRGNILLKQGNPVAAIADLRAVLHDQPGSVAVLRALARAHLANDEPVLAEENLRIALENGPHDLGVNVDLGELLMRTHRAEQAIDLLEQAIKDSPDGSDAGARAALVQAYLAKPDLTAARATADELTRLRPDLWTGPYLAGLIVQQQRPEEAQRDFERALQLQPSASDALTALAHLQLERGQHQEAIAIVRSSVQRTPDSAAAQNLLGELYLADNRRAEAIAAFTEAVRLAPDWWLPYRNLSQAKLAAQDAAGALAACEAGVRLTGDPSLVTNLAALYVQQGRYEDAIRQYEVLHERRPHLDVAANNLAMLLVTYRQDQASLDRARELAAPFANSDVGALLDTHGWVLFKRGEVLAALSALQRASAEAPDSKVILYHLGMVQLKAGQADKARTSLEAALAEGASFSGTAEARLALAQLRGPTG